MSIIIVDNGSSYTKNLAQFLQVESPTIISYEDLDPHNIPKGTTVLLTGGHQYPVLWHKKQYGKEAALIKKHKGPVIGICLGFELIAHTYGSHLHLLNERRKGEVTLIPTGLGPLTIPASVAVYENHNWSVQKLKRPLRALARSEYGIEILKHSRKPIYGMQFHPEMSSKNGAALLTAILDQVKG